MSHIYTAIIGILFIIVTRKIYYRHFELFLCLLIVINFDFFHLVPRIYQYDIYREIVLIVVIFYTIETLFISKVLLKNNFQVNLGQYGYIILLYLLITLMGVSVAYFDGQPIVLGLKSTKWCPSILIFFIVINRKLNINKFFLYFVIMGAFLSVLVIIQYALYHKFQFFFFYEDAIDHVRDIGRIRGLRILEGNSLIFIACLIAIGEYIKSQNLFWLFPSILMLSVIIFIMQFRSQIAALFLAIYFAYCIYNGIAKKRILISLYLTLAGILFVAILLAMNPSEFIYKNSLIHATLRDLDGISSSEGFGNLHIKLTGLENYWAIYKENWFFGRGVLNINWDGNIDYYLQKMYYSHLLDLGVFHLFVNHGIFGLMFCALICFIILSRFLYLNHYPSLILYFISGLILFPFDDLFFRFDRLIIFGIFLALFDKVITSEKENKAI